MYCWYWYECVLTWSIAHLIILCRAYCTPVCLFNVGFLCTFLICALSTPSLDCFRAEIFNVLTNCYVFTLIIMWVFLSMFFDQCFLCVSDLCPQHSMLRLFLGWDSAISPHDYSLYSWCCTPYLMYDCRAEYEALHTGWILLVILLLLLNICVFIVSLGKITLSTDIFV